MESELNIAHRDKAVVTFNIGAISSAISKALLRQREKELKKQKESHALVFTTSAESFFSYLFEEEYYPELIQQKIENDRAEEELQIIKQIKDYKDKDDCVRIKNLVLAQLRGMSRSTAMRFTTDLSLVTMPTPPTVETVSDSLHCGRTAYVGV